MLKVKGLKNFAQIYDYKFEEVDLDYYEEEEKIDEDASPKPLKHLRVYILMERIHGLTMR